MPPMSAQRAPMMTQAGARRNRDADKIGSDVDVDEIGSRGASPDAAVDVAVIVDTKTSKRQLRDVALHLLARWLPRAAPVRPESPYVSQDKRETPKAKAALDAATARSSSDMAACARIIMAAGRRGAQRLAVAFVAADTNSIYCTSFIDELQEHYDTLMRVLLFYAATTARNFLVTLETTESKTSWAQGRDRNTAYEDSTTTTTHAVTRRVFFADTDTEDEEVDEAGNWHAASAPLDCAHLRLHGTYDTRPSAALMLASMIKADWVGDREGFQRSHRPFQADRGDVTETLKPRELRIDYCAKDRDAYAEVNARDILRWLRQQGQLRTLRMVVDDSDDGTAVIQAVAEAGADLEELELTLRYTNNMFDKSPLRSILYQLVWHDSPDGPRTLRFPGLRILRLQEMEIDGKDLRALAGAAQSIEVLMLREKQSITADDWSYALRQMSRLHTLRLPAGLVLVTRIPAFYEALSAPDFASGACCTLRVLERVFAPIPDVMHTVLNAVALHLPNLESFVLPTQIFNALALVSDGDDEVAKRELRAAVQAATRRCKKLCLSIGVGSYLSARLHIKAFLEVLRLLPPDIELSTGAVYTDIEVTQELRDVLVRSSNAVPRSSTVVPECGRTHHTSQVRRLIVDGPLPREDLVTVLLACPNLRTLWCEYGGDLRPAKKKDAEEAPPPPPPFDASLAEAAFLDWLSAIVDVSELVAPPVSSIATTTTTTASVHPHVVVPNKLRQLRVERPPFDGERQAAAMDALQRVRAHSRVRIIFT